MRFPSASHRASYEANMIGSSPTWNRGYQAERFRQDLYYRLNVITIHVPPLRERLQDVPLLAAQLLQTYARDNHKAIVAMQQEAIERLMAYDWPGNVRELENVIERAVVLAQGSVITLADLSLEEPPDKAPCHTNDSLVLPAKATLAQIKREATLQALHRSRGHRSPLTYWGSDPVSHVEKISDAVGSRVATVEMTTPMAVSCQA